jgi:hypothetical protein
VCSELESRICSPELTLEGLTRSASVFDVLHMMMEERYIRRNEELDGIKELCIRDAGYVEVVIRGDRFGPLGPQLAATLVHRPLGLAGRWRTSKHLSRIVPDAVDCGCAPSTSGRLTSVFDTIPVTATRTKSKADIYRCLHCLLWGPGEISVIRSHF